MAALLLKPCVLTTYGAAPPSSRLRVTLPGLSSSSSSSSAIIIRLNKTRHGHGQYGIQARRASAAIPDPLVTANRRDVFGEEQEKIKDYCEKIVPDADIWDLEPELSRYLCSMVTESVRLASIVMELAVIRPDMPNAEPGDYIKGFLERRVHNLVTTTEDVYHKKVTKRTIVSLVDAADSVVFMSYLGARTTLWDLRMNCGPDSDIERAWGEHKREMNKLRHRFDMADPCDAKKMLKSIVTDAIALARSFITLMIAYRKDALEGGTTTTVAGDDGEAADK